MNLASLVLVAACTTRPGVDAGGVDRDGDGRTAERDCDDRDASLGGSEVPYDGRDNDCDAATPDDDLDGDGLLQVDDCDDADPIVGGAEVAYDGVDNDCDADTPDDDLDGDGFALVADCDDLDGNLNPFAAEACDWVDNNCDGSVDVDCPVRLYTIQDNYGDPDRLQTFDTEALTFTDVGPLQASAWWTGLAWDPQANAMWLASEWTFHHVDVLTGSATAIGPMGVGYWSGVAGLAIDDTGTIYATGADALHVIDPSTGAATTIGTTGTSIGPITYDSARDQLVGVGYGGLYAVDRASGATSSIAPLPWPCCRAIAHDPVGDRLWAIATSATSQYVWSIDPNNGYAATEVVNTTVGYYLDYAGLAFRSVD